MPLPNDPIRHLKRRLRLVTALGVALVAVATWWAFRLPESPTKLSQRTNHETALSEPSPFTPSEADRDIDPAVFQVALWNPPPPPPTPEVIQEPRSVARTPLRLQLIGIISGGEEPLAALYDPAEDRLLIVRHGDTVNDRTVTDISSTEVALSDGHAVDTLSLAEPGS